MILCSFSMDACFVGMLHRLDIKDMNKVEQHLKQAATTHGCGPYHGHVLPIWKAILLDSQTDVKLRAVQDPVMR